MDIFHINLASRAVKSYSTRARWALRAIRKYVLLGLKPSGTYNISPAPARAIYYTAREAAVIRALASARGSVARRAQGHRIWPLEGPKGPRVAETCESEGPKGPRTSKAKCPFWRLPVLLYVFHNSAQNREFHGLINRLKCRPKLMKIAVGL